MLKVLIADDEKNICLMIQKLIVWEEYGMEVIDLAHNGVDAMTIIEEKHPDIVISDIRMPGYDGLKLVQKARDLGLETDFVIISGYKYFEYAHRALNLGVEHYLLKPIDKKELQETLHKIIKKRDKSLKKAEEEAQLKEQATYSRRRMQKHFLSSIMENKGALSEREWNRVSTELQCEFQHGCFVAVFSKLDSEVKDQNLTGLLHRMEEVIDRELQARDEEYINSIVQSGVVSIINYRAGLMEEIRQGMERPFRQMRRELDKFQGYHVTIGVGKEKNSIAEIAESIQEAIYAVKCRCKVGLDKMIYYDQLHVTDVPVQEFLNERRIHEIENMTEALDYQSLFGVLQKKLAHIKTIPFYSPVVVYEFLERVAELVLNILKNNHTKESYLHQLEEDLQKVLDFYTELDEMTYRFSEVIRKYFEKVIADRKSRSQLPVRMAKQYVQEYYHKQVTLEDAAESIGLSPAYLSTMFKKEMGINFSDFLISCRMEAAKELLKTTDLSIAEVADRAGYTDPRYFSKTFRKVVGLKPSSYRKLYQ